VSDKGRNLLKIITMKDYNKYTNIPEWIFIDKGN